MSRAPLNPFELINQCLALVFELKLPIPKWTRFRELMATMGDDKSPSDITRSEPTVLTFEAINSGMDPGDANYQRMVQLLNDAMQEVGMRRYQWYFF